MSQKYKIEMEKLEQNIGYKNKLKTKYFKAKSQF